MNILASTGTSAAPEVFGAEEVLAKHDENYMPPEVAEALEISQSGGSMNVESSTPKTPGAY